MNIRRFILESFGIIGLLILAYSSKMLATNLKEIQINGRTNQAENVCVTYTSNQLRDIRDNHGKWRIPADLHLHVWKLKISKRKKRIRVKKKKNDKRYVERGNLAVINLVKDNIMNRLYRDQNIGIATVNIRSMCKKDELLLTFLEEERIDICFTTETWLTENDKIWIDTSALSENNNYNIDSIPRQKRKGGGIALVYKPTIRVERIKTGIYKTMEHCLWKVKYTNAHFYVLGIYHPPPSNQLKHTNSNFHEEFLDLYADIYARYSNIIIMGDLNLHLTDQDDADAVDFNTSLTGLGLTNLVNFPTHTLGNALDAIIINEDEGFILNKCLRGPFLSDHCAVHARLKIQREDIVQKVIKTRDFDDINYSELITKSNIFGIDLDDVNKAACEFEQYLQTAIDELAPLSEKTVTVRRKKFWYTKTLREQKRILRRREKIWRKYREQHQWIALKVERNRYSNLLKFTRQNSIAKQVQDIGRDSKKLYNLISSITGSTKQNTLPDKETGGLCESFADFFTGKIAKICDSLNNIPDYKPQKTYQEEPVKVWDPTSPKEVEKIIKEMPNKQCEQDKIPTALFKSSIEEINIFLSNLFNSCLHQGVFPITWKEAYVKPLLKNSKLEHTEKNYRPVSNLKFISKVFEKIVQNRFNDHMQKHSLMPKYQSAYRRGFSCETALLKIVNDILWAMERGNCVAMVCMDLSAAFDLVAHHLLLNVLTDVFGIEDTALDWFKSYLYPRSFRIYIDGQTSSARDLPQGVAQGSCLGPTLYSCFASTIQEVIPSEVDIHGYADDHTTKKEFNPNSEEATSHCVLMLENTIHDVNQWMKGNKLKMNNDKTEYIVFGSRKNTVKIDHDMFKAGDAEVPKSTTVGYLGSKLDQHLSFKTFITIKCQKAMHNLLRIKAIRNCIDTNTCKTLMCSLVLTHLDYANGILIGLPKCDLNRLQKVQNMAAKVTCRKGRYDSSKDCLIELHWLPVQARIEYKILTILYQCVTSVHMANEWEEATSIAPEYLCELLEVKTPRNLRNYLPGVVHLSIPKIKRQTFAARSFSYIGPKLWEDLPSNLRKIKERTMFKTELKTYLFKKHLTNS